jgi:hypothetical protein
MDLGRYMIGTVIRGNFRRWKTDCNRLVCFIKPIRSDTVKVPERNLKVLRNTTSMLPIQNPTAVLAALRVTTC